MDHWEAHYLVKWEREALASRANYSASAGVPLEDTKWVGKWWFWDEEDD